MLVTVLWYIAPQLVGENKVISSVTVRTLNFTDSSWVAVGTAEFGSRHPRGLPVLV